MLAIACALIQKPKLLLLDELSLGLAPVIVERLLPVVRDFATARGVGVVLVEQHVRLGLEIADRAYVLAHGDLTASGSAEELRNDTDRLVASYLGATPALVISMELSEIMRTQHACRYFRSDPLPDDVL